MLPEELTHAQAGTCLDMLLQAAKAGEGDRVVIDASPLVRFDSSALAVLLACRRECQLDGKRVHVRGLAPRLRELAGLYGVAELLDEGRASGGSGEGGEASEGAAAVPAALAQDVPR